MGVIATKITDKQLEELTSRVGQRVHSGSDSLESNSRAVSRSTIRTWAVLNGDMRPLYMDPDHARRSRWESIIAPPAAIMAFEQLVPEIDCLPGTFPVLHAARLEFSNPIRMNDVVAAESEVLKVEELTKSADDGRVVLARISTEVSLESGQPIGKILLDWHLYERGSRAQHALFDGREIHQYGQEDIEALKLEYKREQQRGADPLYFQEATEGDELPTVLKGPTTRPAYIPRLRDSWYWGHKQGWIEYRKRPELFFMNENNAPEPIMATDWDHHRASRWGGLPGALESNTDRPHHIVHLLANWMGDSGYPKVLDLRFERQNLIGDICRSHARVTGKRLEGDAGTVTLDVWQVNQRGETITNGYAEVLLPLK